MVKSSLVAHVRNDHKIATRPAHLAYKCNVCSDNFERYVDFEVHVTTVHRGSKRPRVAGQEATPSPPLVQAQQQPTASAMSVVRSLCDGNMRPESLNGVLHLSDEISIAPRVGPPRVAPPSRASHRAPVNLPPGVHLFSSEITVTRKLVTAPGCRNKSPESVPANSASLNGTGKTSVKRSSNGSNLPLPELKRIKH